MKKLFSILLAVCVMAGLAVLAAVPAVAEENPYAPPANLNELSQAEQLAYFNLVVNRVREEKPGFRQREREQIEDMQFSGVASAVSGLINSIMRTLMPSEWHERSVAAGESNEGLFMSENENASDLRLEDITSISCEKAGDNWVIDLRIREETNPAKGTSSAHSRIMPIATREEVVAEIVSVGSITADPADATLRYYNGFVRVTVNSQGQVIVAANGCQVLAQMNNVSVSIITMDSAATQNTEWLYAYFDWAPEEPFPNATFPTVEPPEREHIPTFRWWMLFPPWFQWVLRYIFFGWIWMNW